MKARSDRQGSKRWWILPALLVGSFLVLAWSTEAQTDKANQRIKERKIGAALSGKPVAALAVSSSPITQTQNSPGPEVLWRCRSIPFEFNSSSLTDRQIKYLRDCLNAPRANEVLQNIFVWVWIDGHRDSSERYDISLSRAFEAKDFLVNEVGFDANNIFVWDHCDSCPTGSKNPDSNRRIEFGFVHAGSYIPPHFVLSKCFNRRRPCQEIR